MNPALLDYTAAGRPKTLDVAVFPLPYFNGGTPASLLRELVIGPHASGNRGVRKIAGLPYTEAGALVTDALGAIVDVVGGIPVTAAVGRAVAVEFDGVIHHYSNGWPMTIGGRLVLAPVGGFLNLHGFTNGFDQQGFN